MALGAGGVRGAAHVGALRELAAAGLRPSVYAGSSAGALVGSIAASGYDLERLWQEMTELKASSLYDMDSFPALIRGLAQAALDAAGKDLRLRRAPGGIFRGDALGRFVRDHAGTEAFSELPDLLVVVATDVQTGERVAITRHDLVPQIAARLASWPGRRRSARYGETEAVTMGEGQARVAAQEALPATVVLSDIPVSVAVRASAAIPVVFQPVRVGDRVLVDGGVTSYLPADLAFAAGANVVVAIDLGPDATVEEPVDSLLEVGMRALDIMGRTSTDLQLSFWSQAVGSRLIVVRPFPQGAGRMDLVETGEAGAAAMRRALPLVRRSLQVL